MADEAGNELRVCADPNNLPFSNDRNGGFENAIAQLFAKEMGQSVAYTWWAQRRGFIRNTLKAGNCDVIMGVPVGLAMVETTRPYYRSELRFRVAVGPPARHCVDDRPAAEGRSKSAFS